jgi:hypothetical protein
VSVNRSLDAQDIGAVLEQVAKPEQSCTCLQAAAMDAAELSYTEGIKSYEENSFAEALVKFRTALKLHPDHQLATRYLEFTEAKIRLNADAAVLEWRKNIEGRQFTIAAANYRQLQRSNVEGIADSQLHQIEEGYRDLLSQPLESWKRACQDGDSAAMRNLFTKAMDLVADPDLAQVFLAEMKCPTKFCMWTDTTTIMARLSNRVEPVIAPDLRRTTAPTTVYAQVRIDENGNVAVVETQGNNPRVREAVRISYRSRTMEVFCSRQR